MTASDQPRKPSPVTMDDYISTFPADVQEVLQTIRQAIRQAAPLANEAISYKMPTFALGKNIIHFGAFKGHIGDYPPVRDPHLQAQIEPFKGEKGNLRFPLDQPIPYALIGEIVKARLEAQGGKKKGNAPRKPKS